MRRDREESLVEALELAAGFLIAKLTAEHFQKMAGRSKGLAYSGNVRAGGRIGDCDRWKTAGLRSLASKLAICPLSARC
ncbi:MAG: hypothetical protein AAB654_00060 [Acidobacteriota bacterium]